MTGRGVDTDNDRLPVFRYHPDPVATGSMVRADHRCPHCGVDRGYVYTGPVYAAGQPEPPCAECIADGSFAARFDAEFTDPAPLGGLDASVIAEVFRRTPGFTGWQQEQWVTHCGDAGVFLGVVGYEELVAHPYALDRLRDEVADGGIRELSASAAPSAYLFRCRHCGVELATWDAD